MIQAFWFTIVIPALCGVIAGLVSYGWQTRKQWLASVKELADYKKKIGKDIDEAINARDRQIQTLKDRIKRVEESEAKCKKYRAIELDALDEIHAIATKHARPF